MNPRGPHTFWSTKSLDKFDIITNSAVWFLNLKGKSKRFRKNCGIKEFKLFLLYLYKNL